MAYLIPTIPCEDGEPWGRNLWRTWRRAGNAGLYARGAWRCGTVAMPQTWGTGGATRYGQQLVCVFHRRGAPMTVAQDIQKVQLHLTQNMTQVLVLLMAEVDARLKMKSPVDTGRFRASWTIGVGQPDTSVAPAAPARADRGSSRSHVFRLLPGARPTTTPTAFPYARR